MSDRSRLAASSLGRARRTSIGLGSLVVIGASRPRAARVAARCRRRSSRAYRRRASITSRCCSSLSVSWGAAVQIHAPRQYTSMLR